MSRLTTHLLLAAACALLHTKAGAADSPQPPSEISDREADRDTGTPAIAAPAAPGISAIRVQGKTGALAGIDVVLPSMVARMDGLGAVSILGTPSSANVAYGGPGKISAIIWNGGSINLHYTPAGKISAITWNGGSVNLHYSSAGRVSALTLGDTSINLYYTADGKLSAITRGLETLSLHYGSDGLVQSTTGGVSVRVVFTAE